MDLSTAIADKQGTPKRSTSKASLVGDDGEAQVGSVNESEIIGDEWDFNRRLPSSTGHVDKARAFWTFLPHAASSVCALLRCVLI